MDYVARQKAAQGFGSGGGEESEEIDLDKESKAVWAAVAEEEALRHAEQAAAAYAKGKGEEGNGHAGDAEVSSPVLEQAPSHLSSGAGPDGWSPERSEGGSEGRSEDSF